ncbi:hypothetical protein [Marinoscillum sp. MHG1-6]|uniref:hypothetical protein n=1 Tax=Marinoscillum sp. MHG1-6 TaxID=2959627 RepID=UPI002157BF60|nr:hypothetical protein [Marinoscillum sp. MHG1-6]
MHRFFVIIVIAISLLSSCRDEVNPSKLELSYYENALIADTYPYVFEGNNLVFSRHYEKEDNVMVADDEYSEDFLIEVPGGNEHFFYSDEQLGNIGIIYKSYCFCPFRDTLVVLSGTIQGQKNASLWEVKIDITYKEGFKWYSQNDPITYSEELRKTFNNTFTLAEIPSGN